MVKIFVDDERECPEGFLCARTFEEAQKLLLENKGNIEFVSLDVDLKQGCNKNGIYLLPFMQENEIFPLSLNYHTSMGAKDASDFAQDYMPDYVIITCDSYEKVMTRKL